MGRAIWLGFAVKAFRAERAEASAILHSSTKRLLRSTRTPTALLLPLPLMRSASQWPGTTRSPTSGGRTCTLGHVGNLASPVLAPCAWFPSASTLAQQRDKLALEFPSRVGINGPVDGLRAGVQLCLLRMLALGNLARRPALVQQRANQRPKRAVMAQLGALRSFAPPSTPGLRRAAGVASCAIVAQQLAANRAGATPQVPRDGAATVPLLVQC